MQYLRRLKEIDASRMLKWMHDPDINCNFRFDFSKMTLDNVKDFIYNSKILPVKQIGTHRSIADPG